MTLQQLRYVVCVAETKTISEAAQKMFISQPSLTAAIKELEQELNIKIFSRTNKGVQITTEGNEFLGYARQVLEQVNLLSERYCEEERKSAKFCVSCQHYSFAVNAFVDVIKKYGSDEYDFNLRETQTHEIIEDVALMKSEIGILYMTSKNEEIISTLLKKNKLDFTELFTTGLHIFISSHNPLAKKEKVSLKDLAPYPYLAFEQGDHNSLYFTEEPIPAVFLEQKKNISVRDRATLFNLLIGLNGFTISSGIIDEKLNGSSIISRPLESDEKMHIGYITKKNLVPSRYAVEFLDAIKKYLVSQK